MNFLFKKTTWSNWELWLFKACLFFGGIAAGIYFYKYVQMYLSLFFYFFLVTTIYITYLWIKKLNEKN